MQFLDKMEQPKKLHQMFQQTQLVMFLSMMKMQSLYNQQMAQGMLYIYMMIRLHMMQVAISSRIMDHRFQWPLLHSLKNSQRQLDMDKIYKAKQYKLPLQSQELKLQFLLDCKKLQLILKVGQSQLPRMKLRLKKKLKQCQQTKMNLINQILRRNKQLY